MKCVHCGTKNRKKAIYCRACGQRLNSFCPACGARLPFPATFCDQCGHPQSHMPPATEPTALETRPLTTQPPAATGLGDAGHTWPLPSVGALTASGPLFQRWMPEALTEKLQAARTGGKMAGERRIVTMLFCDVSGSTAVAAQFDPEVWTEIINGAFEHMITPVYRYEGTVARLMGDGILAFFGAPIAHEDDPQRAVLAGLDIVSAIESYKQEVGRQYGVDFEVRVGINTGMVVVGNVGSDLRMEYTAMGDAINLAARMEQTAAPGTVQVAQETYNLVASLFDFEDLGELTIKGRAAPLQAYRALSRKSVAARLRGIAGLEAPLIGRQSEWDRLSAAAAALQKGVGQIVFLVGEAGLGKSRLIAELRRSLLPGDNGQLTWYEVASLSYELAQPYSLFQRLIRRLAGIEANDPPQMARDKLETTLAALPEAGRPQARHVFETLFDLESRNGRPPLEGENFRGQLYIVAETLWRLQAEANPVVLVCDDLHWTDPASIGLMEHLLALGEQVAILFLCAIRPDRDAPGWRLKNVAAERYAHRTTVIEVRPLTAEDSGRLIDGLLAISDLPDALRTNIMRRAEGNPFFVEEVVRTLIETGVVRQDGSGARWVATGDGSAIDIPDNLQSLLIARIDKLAEEPRRILQLASVIGRNFYYRVLEQVVSGLAPAAPEKLLSDPDGLPQDLSELQQAGLIREAARIPELEYMFRHSLTQEAAYRTILHRLQRDYHRQVGEAIEGLFPDQLDDYAPALARHFQQAGDRDRAVHYHTVAGDTAFRLYGLAEAVEHYTQALALSDPLALSTEQLTHLYGRRGRALELDNAYDEALDNYLAMERLAGERQDEALRLAGLLARAIIPSTFTPKFDPQLGLPLAKEALNLARRLGDYASEAKALWSLMLVTGYAFSQFEQAISYGQQALALARQYNLSDLLPYILNDLGRLTGFSGLLRPGLALAEEARPLFEQAGNLPLLQDNLSGMGMMYMLVGDLAAAEDTIEEAKQASISSNNRWGINNNRIYIGMVDFERGALGSAAALFEELYQGAEMPAEKVQAALGLGQCCAELGMAGAALPYFEALVAHAGASGPIFRSGFFAQLVRLYLLQGNLKAAERIFDEVGLDLSQELRPNLSNVMALQAYAQLALAMGEFHRVVALMDRLRPHRQRSGLVMYWGELVLAEAQALQALDPPRIDRAEAVLLEAISEHRMAGFKRVLWQLLLALSLLKDADGAAGLCAEAREIVSWMAGELEDPEQHDSFTSQPRVAQLLASAAAASGGAQVEGGRADGLARSH